MAPVPPSKQYNQSVPAVLLALNRNLGGGEPWVWNRFLACHSEPAKPQLMRLVISFGVLYNIQPSISLLGLTALGCHGLIWL